MDLFNPKRLAIVFRSSNASYLMVPQNLDTSHMAVFAPLGAVTEDGVYPRSNNSPLHAENTNHTSSKPFGCLARVLLHIWVCLF